MGRTRQRSGCLRFGCLSVVIVVGALLGWTVIVFGVAFVGSKTESVARQELRRDIDRPSAAATIRPPEDLHGKGRLILDFTVGEFSIRPGRAGEPIRVEANYDTSAYVLEETFESDANASWVYRLTFRETGVIRDGGLRVLFGASYPDLRVHIPPDVPIELLGRFGKGGADIELGGLWLTEIDLELEKGALDVNIGEPLVEPARTLRVHGKQGGMSMSRIGNASPSEVDIFWQQGGSSVDLRGEWVNDSEVTVRSRMGGNRLQLPRGVRIEGLPGRGFGLGPTDQEVSVPTLRITTSSFMGGQSIQN
jgi:hypothetical protein